MLTAHVQLWVLLIVDLTLQRLVWMTDDLPPGIGPLAPRARCPPSTAAGGGRAVTRDRASASAGRLGCPARPVIEGGHQGGHALEQRQRELAESRIQALEAELERLRGGGPRES